MPPGRREALPPTYLNFRSERVCRAELICKPLPLLLQNPLELGALLLGEHLLDADFAV